MGMFDYVKFRAQLPVGTRKKSKIREKIGRAPMQTKSLRLWDNPKFSDRAYNDGCVTVTISADGKLIDPDGSHMHDFTGTINFYGGEKVWVEFSAAFKNGSMTKIKLVEGEPK